MAAARSYAVADTAHRALCVNRPWEDGRGMGGAMDDIVDTVGPRQEFPVVEIEELTLTKLPVSKPPMPACLDWATSITALGWALTRDHRSVLAANAKSAARYPIMI